MDQSDFQKMLMDGLVKAFENRIPRGFESELKLLCLGGRDRHPLELSRPADLGVIVCRDCNRIMARGRYDELSRFWDWLHQVKHEV